jgi:hypothetical protein
MSDTPTTTGDRAEDGAASGGERDQPAADGGDWEQDHDQPGGEAHTPAEHAADPGRRLMLLGDLDFPVGAALDHGRVIGVDQVLLGVQVLDERVVGVSVADVVIHPDIGNERVDCHRGTSGAEPAGGGAARPPWRTC